MISFRTLAAAPTLLLTTAATVASDNGQTSVTRPNIILFLVDDMGWQDTSVPFWSHKTQYNETFETPNMERLASKGCLFTNAYACNLSSASRCSLISGANAARHRVTNWTLSRDRSTDGIDSTAILPDWNLNGIAVRGNVDHTYHAPSFVETLRDSGYHTIHCGKAHFGAFGTPGENPVHFGFETNIAGHAAGGLATYLSEKNYGHRDDGTPYALNAIPGLRDYWGTGIFATEALTREAIKELERCKGYNQPFFLYMAHYAVHIPIDRDMRFFTKYKKRGLSDKEAAYASLVEGMDKSLGDLMDWVDKNGDPDNTIIIFMSDNGGLASSPEWRDGEPYRQNAPLRSGKGSLYEGGIRVPLIVFDPRNPGNGIHSDHPVIIEDLNPTILDLASIEYDHATDGISFARQQHESSVIERPLIWNFPNVWDGSGPGINLNCAIRQGDYKLIYNYMSGEKELFDLSKDISEENNLASEFPEKVKELSAILGTLLRERDAQRPSFATNGKPCPWPDEI